MRNMSLSTLSTLLFIIIYTIYIVESVDIQVVRSWRDSSDRLSPQSSIRFENNAPATEITINIDPSSSYQSILGFGGALTESSAWMYSRLRPDLKQQILNSLFGSGGIDFNIGRVAIGSSDFSLGRYSYNDAWDDFSLQNWDSSHDEQWLFPFVKDAINASVQEIKWIGSPWSPPAWMKSNYNMHGSNLPCLRSEPQYHNAWARYLSKWVTTWNNKGIPIWGITVQNEPEYAPPTEGCLYTAEMQRDFVKNHLGPILKGDHPKISLMIFDHNKDHVESWTNTVCSDSQAEKYVDGVAYHWYSGSQFHNLDATHNRWPNKYLLATEASICPARVGAWDHAERYGYDIIGDLNGWSVGWVDWNILLDMGGGPQQAGVSCDAPILADADRQTITFQPLYWYLGHFSRYIPRGSKRIGHSINGGPIDQIQVTTFMTPSDHVVTVIMNRNDFDVTVKLTDGVTAPNQSANYEIKKHSMSTLWYTKWTK